VFIRSLISLPKLLPAQSTRLAPPVRAVENPPLRANLSMPAAASVIRMAMPNRLGVWVTQPSVANQGRRPRRTLRGGFSGRHALRLSSGRVEAASTALTGQRQSSRLRQQLTPFGLLASGCCAVGGLRRPHDRQTGFVVKRIDHKGRALVHGSGKAVINVSERTYIRTYPNRLRMLHSQPGRTTFRRNRWRLARAPPQSGSYRHRSARS